MKKSNLILLLVIGVITTSFSQQNKIKIISNDGAWCWFSDPRAIYTHGENSGIVTGWVKEDGTIEVAHINKKGEVNTQILASKLDKDDHANPAFTELINKESMVFYTKHFDNLVRHHRSKNIKDETKFSEVTLTDPFDEEELKKFPLRRTTYANPFVLEKENGKMFVFGRWTGFKPNVMCSSDNGKTFSKARVLITNYPFDGNNRPYVKYYSDGASKIHIVFTDGHPRNEPTNSVYYAYYENGAFWKADGSKICTMEELPFEPKDATLVYKADAKKGRSWVYDMGSDKKGNPVLLYARYPDDEHHIYHYTRFDGEKWMDTEICDSGKWFPQTVPGKVELEPNYSGAMTVHPLKCNLIYTSEKVKGVFEIVKYKLNKKGKIKKRIEITKNSKYDNVRPFVPRNMKKGDKTIVLWMQNEKYIHYTDYKTSILSFQD